MKTITDKQRQELEKLHKESKRYQERNRCQCILLSNQGYQVVPLTLLADGLRSIFNEAVEFPQIALQVLLLLGYGVLSFIIGLRVFKWY